MCIRVRCVRGFRFVVRAGADRYDPLCAHNGPLQQRWSQLGDGEEQRAGCHQRPARLPAPQQPHLRFGLCGGGYIRAVGIHRIHRRLHPQHLFQDLRGHTRLWRFQPIIAGSDTGRPRDGERHAVQEQLVAFGYGYHFRAGGSLAVGFQIQDHPERQPLFIGSNLCLRQHTRTLQHHFPRQLLPRGVVRHQRQV